MSAARTLPCLPLLYLSDLARSAAAVTGLARSGEEEGRTTWVLTCRTDGEALEWRSTMGNWSSRWFTFQRRDEK